MNPYTFGTFCSGIGAPEAAWLPLGWKPVFFSEIEPFPCALLAHRYPSVPNFGDMTRIDTTALPEADIWMAGTPCQAFSVAGLRKSLGDDRGNLTLRFCEMVNERNPAVIVWENVPGVLSTKDNAFGCFLAGLVGEGEPLVCRNDSWPNAGMVVGPRRSAAWRVLDAQYFGLAQRRRRVFVVSFRTRDGHNPGAVLFEPDCVRRDTPPSRETGARVAASTPRSFASGSIGGYREGIGTLRAHGGDAHGGSESLIVGCLDSGPDDNAAQANPLVACSGLGDDGDTARALTACKTATGRLDPNEQTFVVTHPLRAEGFDASEDGTGRGTPLVPVAFAQNQRDEIRDLNDCAGSLAAEPGMKQQTFIAQPIPIDMRQASRGATMTNNRREDAASGGAPGTGIGEPGDPSPTVSTSHPPAVAFTQNQIGDILTGDVFASMGTNQNASGRNTPKVGIGMAVRRLTPRECERLQGFPDDFTLTPFRGKPASDGPRYRALGNSMAVPVVRWIGERIAKVLQARKAVSA